MTPHRKASTSRLGFTLLEVMGVLVIAGLIAGVVAVSFGGVVRKATLEEAGARVRWVDGVARSVARGSGETVVLKFEGDRVVREIGKEVASFALPAGYRFGDARAVEIGSEGRSESYCVEVAGRGQSAWVAVAGVSGEGVVTRDRSEAEAVAGR